MSEVTDLIDELRAGTKTLDEVAQRFRERTWTYRPRPKDAEDALRRANEDPEPPLEGSFAEVYTALDRGHISREEFGVLKQAYRDADAANPAED